VTTRISAGGALAAIYVAFFSTLFLQLGPGVVALSALPVVAMGALGGAVAGLIAGIVAFPLNALLLEVNGYPGWDALTSTGGLAASTVIGLAGLGAGALAGRRTTRRR